MRRTQLDAAWEAAELRSMEHEAAKTWGTEVSRAGMRAAGKLQMDAAHPGAGMWQERERLEEAILDLERMEDTLRGDDGRNPMLAQIRERRERLDRALEEVERAHNEAGKHPINVQGHYAGRTGGDKTGTLNLVAHFRHEDGRFKGVLLDNSEIIGAELRRFAAEDVLYEPMMEKLFDQLARSYPEGAISFAFQIYDQTRPTDDFVRFTRSAT